MYAMLYVRHVTHISDFISIIILEIGNVISCLKMKTLKLGYFNLSHPPDQKGGRIRPQFSLSSKLAFFFYHIRLLYPCGYITSLIILQSELPSLFVHSTAFVDLFHECGPAGGLRDTQIYVRHTDFSGSIPPKCPISPVTQTKYHDSVTCLMIVGTECDTKLISYMPQINNGLSSEQP